MSGPDDILERGLARRDGVFVRGSNVVDYWLAHSEGFKLGKPSSVRRVTGVACDHSTGRAHTLFVESGRRRSHRIPARSVAAVDPFNKVLYLERRAPVLSRARAVSPYTQRAFRAGTASARRSGGLAAAGFLAGWRYGKDGLVWARPRVLAAARTTALLLRKHYAETALRARARYAEIALWLIPHLAAGLRAAAAGTEALVVAVRRRYPS